MSASKARDAGGKHTAGPWEAVEVRTSVGRAFRIGAGEMLATGKGCCIIYDDYPGNPDNERAANARLIAAAPDLLEALLAQADQRKRGILNMTAAELDRVDDLRRAAIAKATGAA